MLLSINISIIPLFEISNDITTPNNTIYKTDETIINLDCEIVIIEVYLLNIQMTTINKSEISNAIILNYIILYYL